MFKKHTRIVAFIGTLGASATLIGMAATNTGAYFTDSETGTLSGTGGHVVVDKRSDYSLNFSNSVPGEDQQKEVVYATDSSTPEDIWLKFPAGSSYGSFTGAADGSDGAAAGGLGRYAHFKVLSDDGSRVFESYNLTNASHDTSGCADGDGHGFGRPATSRTDTPPNCGVPHFIKVESNVPSGSQKKITLAFGLTGRASNVFQNLQFANVPFEVVATQHGVRPDAENF